MIYVVCLFVAGIGAALLMPAPDIRATLAAPYRVVGAGLIVLACLAALDAALHQAGVW